jgi:leucyl-tRNA synthetase
VSTKEPFSRLRHQGIILGEDSRKMSKSRGNVVNPDDVISQYGADSMRLFEMFLGPLEEMKPWSTRGVEGVFRFLNRVWRLFVDEMGTLNRAIVEKAPTPDFERLYHQCVKKVGEDIEGLHFNTAISQLMIFLNEAMKLNELPRKELEQFVLLLSPFAPHVAEELWRLLGHPTSLAYEPWPSFDAVKIIEEKVEIVLQVNGKVRSKLEVAQGTSDKELENLAFQDPNIQRHTEGKRIVRAIVVKNKLVNVVVAS